MKTFEFREERFYPQLNDDDFNMIDKTLDDVMMWAVHIAETEGRDKALEVCESVVGCAFEDLVGEEGKKIWRQCETQEDFDKLLDTVDIHSFYFRAFIGVCHTREFFRNYKEWCEKKEKGNVK